MASTLAQFSREGGRASAASSVVTRTQHIDLTLHHKTFMGRPVHLPTPSLRLPPALDRVLGVAFPPPQQAQQPGDSVGDSAERCCRSTSLGHQHTCTMPRTTTFFGLADDNADGAGDSGMARPRQSKSLTGMRRSRGGSKRGSMAGCSMGGDSGAGDETATWRQVFQRGNKVQSLNAWLWQQLHAFFFALTCTVGMLLACWNSAPSEQSPATAGMHSTACHPSCAADGPACAGR